jgi:ssRNA-specific RNase YbeY (16S rRNA maturation enzyme)
MGGATDVLSLEEWVENYDSDHYGDINIYDESVCPCVMCMTNEK